MGCTVRVVFVASARVPGDRGAVARSVLLATPLFVKLSVTVLLRQDVWFPFAAWGCVFGGSVFGGHALSVRHRRDLVMGRVAQ